MSERVAVLEAVSEDTVQARVGKHDHPSKAQERYVQQHPRYVQRQCNGSMVDEIVCERTDGWAGDIPHHTHIRNEEQNWE